MRKLFWEQSFHMILTVLILICYIVTLYVFQVKQPVDRNGKRTFTVVVTVLILGLGLNFFKFSRISQKPHDGAFCRAGLLKFRRLF